MKKRLLFLSALTLCVLLCLASCMVGAKPEPENMIYRSDSELYIVVADGGFSYEDADEMFYFLSGKKDKIPVMTNQTGAAHEIVIGNGGTELCRLAYAELARLTEGENMLGYVIYSDGASLCIAYSEEDDRLAADLAVEYFLENLIVDELIAPAGVVKSYAFDVEKHFQDIDDAAVEQGWKDLAAASTQDIADAMRDLYTIYDDTTVDWLANLYDPGIGGFYHTNSARDTYGYLPDAESTAKLLSFLESSGMVENYATALPEWMKKQIGDFVYGLQDPNGYFYNPQWGDEISLAKRGRDLNWCTSILKKFGRSPKYQTITGVGGDVDMTSASPLTGALGGSAVAAVSRVVAVADDTLIPDHLLNEENFLAYLESLDITKKSYSRGNELSSQVAQIKARELDGVLLDYLNSIQFDTGLWHAEKNHYAINGLMKICGLYNSCKQAMPNAEQAAMAAIDVLIGDVLPADVICIYNPWVSIGRITNNQLTYGGDEGAAIANRISDRIISVAPQALAATKENLKRFIVDDTKDNTKSFSYNLGYAASGIQGSPAAVPGLYEGDLGGTNNACAALVSSIYTALKLSDHFVPIYTNSDFRRFISIVENLAPIEKVLGEVSIDDPESFDDHDPDSDYDGVTVKVRNVTGLYGDYGVVADPRGEGCVFEYDQHTAVPSTSSGAYVTFPADNSITTNVCSVWEADMCVYDVQAKPANGIIARFEMGRSAYYVQLVVKDGRLQLWEFATGEHGERNDLGVDVALGEWFNLRVEYYLGDHDTVRIKVYFNQDLIAISDNYYTGDGAPTAKYKEVYLYVVKATVAKFGFDNVNCYNCNEEYKYEEPAYSWAINVDAPDRDEKEYSFDELPDDFTVDGSVSATDGALKMGADSSVKIPVNAVSAKGNAIELAYTLTASGSGALGSISFIERNSTANTLTRLGLSSDGQTVTLTDADGATISGAAFDDGATVDLRILLFEDKDAALIYIDGALCAITTAMSAGGESLAAAFVSISASAGIELDDLICQRVLADYDKAVSGEADSVIHDFEYGLGDADTDGRIVSASGDKVLSLDGEYVTVPVINTAAVSTATSASLSLTFVSADDGELYRLALTDGDGEIILAFAVVCEDGVITLREQTALGTHSGALYTFTEGIEAALRLEYFSGVGVCNIYVDDTCVFASTLPWSIENAKLLPATFSVTPLDASAAVYVDDIRAENIIGVYEEKSVSIGNGDEKNTVIGFETSCAQKLPSRVTTSLASVGASVSVAETVKNDLLSKVLAISSTDGAMDTVSVKKTSAEKGDTTVLEMDVRISPKTTSSLFQLWLMSGDNTAYLIVGSVKSGNIVIKDSTWTKAAEGRLESNEIVLAASDEWVHLRVEYSVTGGIVTARVLADDALLFETTGHHYGAHNGTSPYADITGMDLKFYKAAEGTIYIDNVFLGEE